MWRQLKAEGGIGVLSASLVKIRKPISMAGLAKSKLTMEHYGALCSSPCKCAV